MDLVIKNGRVVTDAGVMDADVGIDGERIVGVARNLTADRVVDAQGHYVFPGFVDAHVHLQMTVGEITTGDDFASGTRAAACSGTTTVVDFTSNVRGEDLAQAAASRRAEADGSVSVDYSLHLTLADSSKRTLDQLRDLSQAGYASAKMYTTYEAIRVRDEEMLQLLAVTRECGIMPMIHAENHAAIAYLTAQLVRQGKTAPRYHPLSRPPMVEAEAANRVLALAGLLDAPVYIAHLTCRETLEAVVSARHRGQKVYAETCPQYLFLCEADYERPGFEGAKFVLSPPLRNRSNWDVLWQALEGAELQAVSTDHCPWYYQTQKTLGRNSFEKIPNGAPGIETRVPLMFSEGVQKGRLSLERFVAVCATEPARLHGLYPRKGTVGVGSDADLVIYDPERPVTLAQQSLHQRVDYCPYEGLELRGYPRTVLLRGQVIVEDGEFVGRAGQGRFVPGRPFAA